MQENHFCGLCQVSESQVKLFLDKRVLLGSWNLQLVCELGSSRHCGAVLLSVNVHVSHLGRAGECISNRLQVKPMLLIPGQGSHWASENQRIPPCVWPGSYQNINYFFAKMYQAQLEWDL